MLTGLSVIVGRTPEEAQAKAEEYRRHWSRDGIMAHYAGSSGFDLSSYDPNEYLEYRDTDHRTMAAPTRPAAQSGPSAR